MINKFCQTDTYLIPVREVNLKSRSFSFMSPSSLDEACSILAECGDDAKVLAGGQSLVPAMNMRFASPEILISLNGIADMADISLEQNFLRIGAMSRHIDVMNSELVARYVPLIHSAMPHIAHAAIRNRGTLGGSLANADPASELPACAIALNAILNVQSSTENRTITAENFFEGTYATNLRVDEILVSIDIPIVTPGSRFFFDEICRRRGDFAIAGLAVQVNLNENVISTSRIVFFGVSDRPLIAQEACNYLNGRSVTAIDSEVICGLICNDIELIEDLTTSSSAKLHLMKVLMRRAIATIGKY